MIQWVGIGSSSSLAYSIDSLALYLVVGYSMSCVECWQVHLSEREKQKLQVWARVMPFREPFAWATVSLFDANVTGGVGGFTSPSSPLPQPTLLGSGLMEASLDIDGRLVAGDSKHHEPRQHEPVLVDVPSFNRVKENYMEETLLVGTFVSFSCILSFRCWWFFDIID